MRLFIAIELPAELKRKLGQLRTEIPGVRWVPAEQIHLTLSFLGDVDEETMERLSAHLTDIRANAFKLSCGRIGCFPNRQLPRVVWIGVNAEPGLLKLAAAVQQSALYAGIPLEERPFSPHLTLARLKLPSSAGLRAFLDRQNSLSFKPFAVHEFTLFQSRLTSQGAMHSPVKSFPLIDAGSEGLC